MASTGDEQQQAQWLQRFRGSVSDLPRCLAQGATHEQAAERLRALVRSGIVRHTDVRDAPGE